MKQLRNDLPPVGAEGYSDPVAVITEHGQMFIGVYDKRDGFWHIFEDGEEECIGYVMDWQTFPKNWVWDSDFYTPIKKGLGNEDRHDEGSEIIREYRQNATVEKIPSEWRKGNE